MASVLTGARNLNPLFLFDLANVARVLADAMIHGKPVRQGFCGSATDAAEALARSLGDLRRRLGQDGNGKPAGDLLCYATTEEGITGELAPNTLDSLSDALQAASREVVREAKAASSAAARERDWPAAERERKRVAATEAARERRPRKREGSGNA